MPEQEVRDRTNQAKSEQHFSNYNPIFQSHRDNWEEWEDFLLLSPFLHSTEIYWKKYGKEPVFKNGTANFSLTSATNQSGLPLEEDPNILIEQNQNGPFHLDFHLKVAEFCDKMESTL